MCGGEGRGIQRFVKHCLLSFLVWHLCHTEKGKAGCFVYLLSCIFLLVSKIDQDQDKNAR